VKLFAGFIMIKLSPSKFHFGERAVSDSTAWLGGVRSLWEHENVYCNCYFSGDKFIIVMNWWSEIFIKLWQADDKEN
jgi:hypothetical protein